MEYIKRKSFEINAVRIIKIFIYCNKDDNFVIVINSKFPNTKDTNVH